MTDFFNTSEYIITLTNDNTIINIKWIATSENNSIPVDLWCSHIESKLVSYKQQLDDINILNTRIGLLFYQEYINTTINLTLNKQIDINLIIQKFKDDIKLFDKLNDDYIKLQNLLDYVILIIKN